MPAFDGVCIWVICAFVRLAIPKNDSWMILMVDMNALLNKYSNDQNVAHKFKSIRKIQLCSSMLLRDVVTSDRHFATANVLPKELAIKVDSRKRLAMTMVDVLSQSESIMPNVSVEKSSGVAVGIDENEDQNVSSATKSVARVGLSTVSPRASTTKSGDLSQTPTTPTSKLMTMGSQMKSPATEFKLDPKYNLSAALIGSPEDQPRFLSQGTTAGVVSASSSAVFRPTVPETPSQERVLSLQRILHYSGGPALLLYDGKMIVQLSGRLIVLVDVEDTVEKQPGIVNQGLWRAFAKGSLDATTTASLSTSGGYRQAFLKGHHKPISFLEVRY
jgi:hypothetical protein